MIRRENLLRSFLLAGMLFSLMMLASSNIVSAQDLFPCKCEVGTISVGKLDCKFELCIKDAEGLQCFILGPGSVQQFKCHEKAAIFIRDCQGNLNQIIPDRTGCVQCICAGCCVADVCISYDKAGCLQISIQPSQCKKKCG